MGANQTDKTGAVVARLVYASRGRGVLSKVPQLLLRFAFGVEFPPGTVVGAGLDLPHGARGLVVHDRSVIGNDVTLHHNVTLGARRASGPAPVLEDEVNVGAGAAVLGGITVGKGSTIGANAVVLTDVPSGAVAVGNPARIITR